MPTPILRVHPAIGLARVGNSDDYYLAPESIAGLPIRGREREAEKGGLPIRPGTEAETIKSSELRDAHGCFKRQAARFRIYQYPASSQSEYPASGGREVVIGSRVGGRKVVDIIWMVHLANKKAAWYESPDDTGIVAYEDGATPPLRNLSEGLNPHNTTRLVKLIVDPGPRTVRGKDEGPVRFDQTTAASYCHDDGKGVCVDGLPRYPKSFPQDHFPEDMLVDPQGPINTLGELLTDNKGRLLVAGGRGKAVGWLLDGKVPRGAKAKLNSLPITQPVNNDQWFDDTSDGPVSAWLVYDDGSAAQVHGGWVVVTDPAYAPQTLNVVSLWDEAYDTFLRKLRLDPRIYRGGRYQRSFKPSFEDHVRPVFRAAALQMWNTYLPSFAINAHQAVDRITAADKPDDTIMAELTFVRNPNNPQEAEAGAPLMPLSLGDSGKAFLSPSLTQYFFLEQWAAGAYRKSGDRKLGFGEYLDKATLANCLGGRFSPGIDITFIIREPELYIDRWQASGAGPFRIRPKKLDYGKARGPKPFLTLGWVPRHAVAVKGVEPGDICKFMAIPWHADYNSCAIHSTAPNPLNSNTLYWSWPAQRPVTTYVAEDVQDGELPVQRYSVRGPGTYPLANSPTDKHDLGDAGRFWDYNQMLVQWQDIGVIMQATNIDDGREAHYRDEQYLEVQSRLGPEPAKLAEPHPWPLIGGDGTATKK